MRIYPTDAAAGQPVCVSELQGLGMGRDGRMRNGIEEVHYRRTAAKPAKRELSDDERMAKNCGALEKPDEVRIACAQMVDPD